MFPSEIELFQNHLIIEAMMVGHLSEDGSKGTRFERTMSRDSEMMLAVLERGQTPM
jgi:hypothetical protein